jgi:pimeloyl-ACP methyl ester carboxylesterase
VSPLRPGTDRKARYGPGMSDDGITAFRIDIPEQDLAELAARLDRTRWPAEVPGAGWSDGAAASRVRELAGYWRHQFDWPAQQARLNQFPQFTTVIDGQRIHFLHVRSPEPGALPLILTHGWPGSVAEFAAVIGPLTDPAQHGGDPADAFDVVAPSLPGFGFSAPLSEPGWGVERTARAWAALMARLGYDRYGAQGGDWGARISPQLARTDPAHVAGVHVNALVALPGGAPGELEPLDADDLAALAGLRRWNAERSGYAQIMSTRPQTLAYALDDSPAGLLAWNLEWFDDYGEHPAAIPADAILANVALYWLTGTAGSSAHLYKEAAASWGQPAARSPVPTAVAVFPGDSTVRAFAERDHRVVRWTRFDRGGHFAALQAPGLLVGDVRAFFRGLR